MNWVSTKDNPLGKRMPDGSSVLFAGYDNLRLLAVALSSGEYEYILGRIDHDGGVVFNDTGDGAGWEWDAVSAYVDIELLTQKKKARE